MDRAQRIAGRRSQAEPGMRSGTVTACRNSGSRPAILKSERIET